MTALVTGGAPWITAAIIGGDDETTRFYTAEAVWLAAQLCLLLGTYALWRLRPQGQRLASGKG